MKLEEIVLNSNETVVLAIDIQNDFLKAQPGFVFYDAGNDVSQMQMMVISHLLPFLMRSIGRTHVAYVKAEYKEGAFPPPYDKLCSRIPGADFFLIDSFAPDKIFTKIQQDPFTNPELTIYIQENETRNIVLIGVTLTNCINTAVQSALKVPNAKVIVPQDCIGYRRDRADDARRIIQSYLADTSIIVVDSTKIIYN